MGCLNSSSSFDHVFGNIHFSGPCNRACYFCIGQHMMALDALNTLDVYPLPGLDAFIERCHARDVSTIYWTGTNTDPILYLKADKLAKRLRAEKFRIGIRTNGVQIRPAVLNWMTCGSLTVCSLKPEINRAMMGGAPPDVRDFILATEHWDDRKVNIVLGPENRRGDDWYFTVMALAEMGISRVNLREPYGQPRVGNPLEHNWRVHSTIYGMPRYECGGALVTYWDVHFCEVESVNLYANGRVSEDYPITRGHADDGIVLPQSEFLYGRQRDQWVDISTRRQA